MFVETEFNNHRVILPCVVTRLNLCLSYGVICGEHLKVNAGNVSKGRYTPSAKLSDFTV
jgi:hypothetical protein